MMETTRGRGFPTSELGKRLLVAIVLLPPVAAIVRAGGPWMAALLAAAAAIAAGEYVRLVLGRLDGAGWLQIVRLVGCARVKDSRFQ